MRIPFNRPFLTGKETDYIEQAVRSGKISGNGDFTRKCHRFFEQKYGFKKCLLTTSCTAALEMAAILIDIVAGDEIIVPSFTFVSSANAFVLRGATIVFADSYQENPNLDPELLEALITPKTKAIVVVHYAGIACDMDRIMEIAARHSLFVIEDAAQAIDSYYKGRPLGGIGHLGAFSFHETKNIISGEGGMLVVNDDRFLKRSEIIWEKGTNRSAFFRGETDKYSWVDIGSSFLPSEVIAAFLYAQLENLEHIQKARMKIWDRYFESFATEPNDFIIGLPVIPEYATNNAHMFFLVCSGKDERDALIRCLKKNDILAVFHYLPLHKSPFYKDKHDGRRLPNCERFAKGIIRLPFFYALLKKEQLEIINIIKNELL
ncbi:MAG TPA: dTDP-4-amino-4,6-dideoxygalactose transaminase [Eudoraea sp.]|nr:dTDP-4-amino-4,6-dideoxygalactose transaminase [Eudoraea sp.]